LSSVNVYARDLQNIVSVLILFLMLVSPIAYTEDMIPPEMRPFLAANPVYYLIVSYQDVLMLGHFPRGNIFWILLFISFFTFIFGYWFFMKMKRVFADNV
jgi:lipopolysaccharide transport system permease protein